MRRKLRKALEVPFPERWRALLAERTWWWPTLGEGERARLEDLIRLFLAGKSFEGTRGFEPTEEMRVLIAAQACLLILDHDFGLYDDVTSIIVSPSAVPHRGPRRLDGGIESDEGTMLAGQAMLHGPVLITWDSASNQARHPERGHNVVFHEFAHKLDMRNGAPDGVPPLSAELKERWEPALRSILQELRDGTAAGLDSYGATNPAELLAVATEAFFDTPVALRRHQPELYALLEAFYRQDPAGRQAP
ncbi:MAG: zinc-dependent peptidase [Actinobacteria bacterium]|nr:zinc-dependent peptidase [Actinomycetota bacterium]